jgi:hypothetical protein
MSSKDLKNLKKDQLTKLAKKQKLSSYAKMTKEELVKALSKKISKTTKKKSTAAKATVKKKRVTKPTAKKKAVTSKKAAKPTKKKRAKVSNAKKTVAKLTKKTTPRKKRVKKVAKKTIKTTLKKKPATSKKRVAITPKTTRKKAQTRSKPTITKKLTASSYEELVGESKYYTGISAQPSSYQSQDELPQTYNENKIILLVRDPYWLHACWDITPQKITAAKNSLGSQNFNSAKPILRVTELQGNAPKSYFDIEISRTNNWYINIPKPNASYCVDIGYLTIKGKFFSLARSNTVATPRPGVAPDYPKNKGALTPEEYDKIYALSGGFNIGLSSGEISKEMRKKLAAGISSAGVSSLFSGFAKKNQEGKRDFFLNTNTELIVYGATLPSAKLTIQGRPKKLNPDGTFAARFALPDSKQVISIRATSKDDIDSITITPVVEKRTE